MASATAERFRFSYGAFRLLMSSLGLGPAFSRIEVRPTEVVVQMGWGFRARVPRSAITGASEDRVRGFAIGVHGGRGQWLVNGSTSGIVTLLIDPPCRAVVMGFPVKLERLQVSAEDPSGLLSAIGRS